MAEEINHNDENREPTGASRRRRKAWLILLILVILGILGAAGSGLYLYNRRLSQATASANTAEPNPDAARKDGMAGMPMGSAPPGQPARADAGAGRLFNSPLRRPFVS